MIVRSADAHGLPLPICFEKRGRYPYWCSIDSHAELGMKGVFRVMS